MGCGGSKGGNKGLSKIEEFDVEGTKSTLACIDDCIGPVGDCFNKIVGMNNQLVSAVEGLNECLDTICKDDAHKQQCKDNPGEAFKACMAYFAQKAKAGGKDIKSCFKIDWAEGTVEADGCLSDCKDLVDKFKEIVLAVKDFICKSPEVITEVAKAAQAIKDVSPGDIKSQAQEKATNPMEVAKLVSKASGTVKKCAGVPGKCGEIKDNVMALKAIASGEEPAAKA